MRGQVAIKQCTLPLAGLPINPINSILLVNPTEIGLSLPIEIIAGESTTLFLPNLFSLSTHIHVLCT